MSFKNEVGLPKFGCVGTECQLRAHTHSEHLADNRVLYFFLKPSLHERTTQWKKKPELNLARQTRFLSTWTRSPFGQLEMLDPDTMLAVCHDEL
jgi:hypothetical protein